jgi:hypothetical protein
VAGDIHDDDAAADRGQPQSAIREPHALVKGAGPDVVVGVGVERLKRLTVVAEQSTVEGADEQVGTGPAVHGQQYLQPLSRELLAPWNCLELVAHHALEPDALVVYVVDAANPEPVQESPLWPPAADLPPGRALRVGRRRQPKEDLARLKVDPLGGRVSGPDVVEVAVLLRDMLHQGHVLQLPVRIGRKVANLAGTADVQPALVVLGNGAHDGPVDRLDQPPRRSVVLEDTQAVADVDQTPVVFGEHPVL